MARCLGLFQVKVIVLSLVLSGCSKFESSIDGSPVTMISGVVQLGPVKQANVKAYCLADDGQRAASPLGVATSDSEGKFSIALSQSPNCSILLASTGGQYTEESSGEEVTIEPTSEIRSILEVEAEDKGEVAVSVTPVSEMAVARYEAIRGHIESAGQTLSGKEEINKVIERAKEEVRTSVGLPEDLDVTRVVPAHPERPASDSKANKLAVVIAGISQMAAEKGKNSLQLSSELAADAADGKIEDEAWLNLPTHINSWTSGPRNSGGFQPVANLAPVLVPSVDGEKFPLPTATVGVDLRTVPFRLALTPPTPLAPPTTQGCVGPFRIELLSITNEHAAALQGLEFEAVATNTLGQRFSTYKDLESCNSESVSSNLHAIATGSAVLDTFYLQVGSNGISAIQMTLLPKVRSVLPASIAVNLPTPPPPPANNTEPEIHMIGVYEGQRTTTIIPTTTSTHYLGTASVEIKAGTNPVVLVLASYEAVDWTLTGATSRVVKVITHGYYRQNVTNIGAIPLESSSYATTGSYFYGLNLGNWPYSPAQIGYQILAMAVQGRNQAKVQSMQGAYQKGSFIVDDGLHLPPALPAATLNPVSIYGLAFGGGPLLRLFEGTGTANATISLYVTTANHPGITVDVEVHHGTTDDQDIPPFKKTVTIPAGSSMGFVSIPYNRDTFPEGGREYFRVSFSNPSTGQLLTPGLPGEIID